MAVSATSYFSNAVVGVPQVGGDFNVFQIDTTPKLAIGTKFERQDGAVFRYSHFGVAITSAGLVLASSITNGMANTAACVVASSSTYQMPVEQSGTYPNMKGSKFMVITKASITADDFQGCYAVIGSTGPLSNCGYTYRIKGNTATGDPVAGNFRLELYDKLQAHLNSSTNITIAGNAYSSLEPAVMYTNAVLAGVSMTSSSAADRWGWIQTKGIVAIHQDVNAQSLLAFGTMAALSSADAGSVCAASIYTAGTAANQVRPLVGYTVAAGASGCWTPIKINLE